MQCLPHHGSEMKPHKRNQPDQRIFFWKEREMNISRQWRRMRPPLLPSSKKKQSAFSIPRKLRSKTLIRFIPLFIVVALSPLIFFHFRLKHFQQVRLKKCGWIEKPPLVCAHGGDSSKAIPNTMDAYRIAIESRVDCVEIDVSRSYDGELFALHDRDLQRMSSNSTANVGYMSKNEIKELDAGFPLITELRNQKVPTIEDALKLVSSSVSQVILDAKVGPPFYEKGLANDILSVVRKANCENCMIWAKNDNLVKDIISLTPDIPVGYIVMKSPAASTSKLLRIKDAKVVGAYHPMIDERLVKTVHGKMKKVYAWTVDDEKSMRRILYAHVDAIVTSHPSKLQRLMEDIKTECLEEGFFLP